MQAHRRPLAIFLVQPVFHVPRRAELAGGLAEAMAWQMKRPQRCGTSMWKMVGRGRSVQGIRSLVVPDEV